jgi:hypothetical protein
MDKECFITKEDDFMTKAYKCIDELVTVLLSTRNKAYHSRDECSEYQNFLAKTHIAALRKSNVM